MFPFVCHFSFLEGKLDEKAGKEEEKVLIQEPGPAPSGESGAKIIEAEASPRKRRCKTQKRETDPQFIEQAAEMRREVQAGCVGQQGTGHKDAYVPYAPFAVASGGDGSETLKGHKSFAEAISFYDSFLDEVLARDDDAKESGLFNPETCTLNDLAHWLSHSSHSSAFTGIAAPETALLGLHRAVQARMPEIEAGSYVGGAVVVKLLLLIVSYFWCIRFGL